MSASVSQLLQLITAYFQAGGGGDFGSSDFGSSDFGGDSGGSDFGGSGFGFDSGTSNSGDSQGGEALSALISWLVEHPWVSVPLMLLVGYLIIRTYAEGERRVITRTIRKGRKVQQDELMTRAIARIHHSDANFLQPVFLERVTLAFRAIQECWSQQDLRKCRAFISDGVHERFQLYLQMQKAEGVRQRIDDLEVAEAKFVAVHSESQFDTIHVMFIASAVIADEPLGQPAATRARIPRKAFSEVWSFARRHGAVTRQQTSVLAGQCPHCGVGLEIVDKPQCSHCKSFLNSGYDDWVLAEITQDCEWLVADSAEPIPSWNELISADPGLSLQQLEDRASVVLWRCLMSLYFQQPAMAAPVLSQGLSGIPAAWRVSGEGFWKRPAMGSVEVVRCHSATSAQDFDRAVVLLRWSGTKATGHRSTPRLLNHQSIYSHEVTLIRRHGVQSKIESTFSSFSCRACGGPIDVAGADSCTYCDKSLNDGSYDWVVESVDLHQPFSNVRLPQPVEAPKLTGWQLKPQWLSVSLQPLDSLIVSARMLMSDGELAEVEKEFLRGLAECQQIPAERLEECIAAAKSATDEISLPGDTAQARLLMQDLMRVAFVDGRVTRHELAMLRKISGPLNWSTADVRQAIGRTRKELVRELQEARRLRK